MNAAPHERQHARPDSDLVGMRPDMAPLLARRRAARRRTRLARIDLGLGALFAILLLLLAPGLAIVTLVAFVLILACAISLLAERRSRDGRRLLPPLPRLRGGPRHATQVRSAAPRPPASQVELQRERGGGSL